MPYNPYQFQQPPYGYQQPYQPAPQKPTFDFVNGVEGAKSYQVMPSQTAILMDTENSACYIKSSNGIGQATIKYFKVTECAEQDLRTQKPSADFVTKDEFKSFSDRLSAIESAMKKEEK